MTKRSTSYTECMSLFTLSFSSKITRLWQQWSLWSGLKRAAIAVCLLVVGCFADNDDSLQESDAAARNMTESTVITEENTASDTSSSAQSSTDSSEEQFVAELSDLMNYREWLSIDYSIGPTHPALAGRHGGDGEQLSRRVFANDIALSMADGTTEFPVGSAFVSEISHFEDEGRDVETIADEGGLLAMVKRGGDFNPDGGGWEWFVLANDRSRIVRRGADFLDRLCSDCHQMASEDAEVSDDANSTFGGLDFVFRHPSERDVEDDFFVGYQQWPQIDEISAVHPLLTAGAHAGNEPTAVRRVYQKQLYARPVDDVQGFPVGTALAKAVFVNDELTGLVGMVKRTGNIENSAANDSEATATWEWFRIDPSTEMVTERGTDLGMCAACHQAANDPSEGRDFVFNHTQAPFVTASGEPAEEAADENSDATE